MPTKRSRRCSGSIGLGMTASTWSRMGNDSPLRPSLPPSSGGPGCSGSVPSASGRCCRRRGPAWTDRSRRPGRWVSQYTQGRRPPIGRRRMDVRPAPRPAEAGQARVVIVDQQDEGFRRQREQGKSWVRRPNMVRISVSLRMCVQGPSHGQLQPILARDGDRPAMGRDDPNQERQGQQLTPGRSPGILIQARTVP